MRNNHAFTMIELMVAIAILGGIMAILMPALIVIGDASRQERTKLEQSEATARVMGRLRQDIRCASAVFLRAQKQGFALRMADGRSDGEASYIAYDFAQGNLYRIEFSSTKGCQTTRLLGKLAMFQVTANIGSGLLTVELAMSGGNRPKQARTYRIVTRMRGGMQR